MTTPLGLAPMPKCRRIRLLQRDRAHEARHTGFEIMGYWDPANREWVGWEYQFTGPAWKGYELANTLTKGLIHYSEKLYVECTD